MIAGSSVLAHAGWNSPGFIPTCRWAIIPRSVAAAHTLSKSGCIGGMPASGFSRHEEGTAPPLTHARELGNDPVEVVEAQGGDGTEAITMRSGSVGHPGVDRFERALPERYVVDRARQRVAGTGDEVLVRDADIVHPRDARRGIGHGLELVRSRVADTFGAVRVEHELHHRGRELFDRHALLAGHVAQEIVGNEVGEHLAGVESEPRIRVGEELGELGLERGKVVEPVGGGLEVSVDIEDGHRGAHFIIPPETDRSSPVTNDDASLTR